ncbi:MAG: phosphatase PAP2 family protein [Actinobacteria bacterium]|nr:phosphatase PAP2 family protein [Actinomycetota bacterium]
MKWVTWNQAIIASVISIVTAYCVARLTATPRRVFIIAICREFSLVAFLYTLWRLAMVLPLDQPVGALSRARSINTLQHHLFLPSELSLQHFVMRYEWLARATNYYYAIVHVPATIAFLVWLFVRHRDSYPRWRNVLAMLTAACLVIRYVRVAPPRFLPELGYIDLATRYGLSVYGPVGTGVSDQFAAMPSIHVGWAALVSFGIIAASTSKWRWLFASHFVITMLAVSATGNHWWLDGIAAIALVGIALRIDGWLRCRVG